MYMVYMVEGSIRVADGTICIIVSGTGGIGNVGDRGYIEVTDGIGDVSDVDGTRIGGIGRMERVDHIRYIAQGHVRQIGAGGWYN